MREWKSDLQGTPFNWEQFEKNFFKPNASLEWLNPTSNDKMPWLEEYIKQCFLGMMPNMGTSTNAGRDTNAQKPPAENGCTINVMETERLLIAQLRLPKGSDLGALRVFVGCKEIWVKGLPDVGETRFVLPANVRTSGAKAFYRGEMIEVRMLKESDENYFMEIPIGSK